MSLTFQSEFGELKSLLLKTPKESFISQGYVEEHWRDLNYLAVPDFAKAQDEYEAFKEIFTDRGVAIELLEQNDKTGMDSIYVRDASIATDHGMLICEMGKQQRSGEPAAQMNYYLQHGLQVLGKFTEGATIEGGDVAWLRPDVLAVARGYRTNQLGIDQLKSMLGEQGVHVEVMDAPHYKGPDDVFHLMSVISPVDKDLAVVYSPLMTVPFRESLISMGYKFVEVPDGEFESQGCNILAIAPRVCVMVKGNPVTKSLLEAEGVEVIEFDGKEISVKGSGGPTCLTRPLVRSI
jgi:N-dimethylarginine dimethylaminohydrolase